MVYLRENESVAVEPVRVLWVEGHEFVEQDVGHWCHAHWGARMANVGFGDGIDLRGHSGQHVYPEHCMETSRTGQCKTVRERYVLLGV